MYSFIQIFKTEYMTRTIYLVMEYSIWLSIQIYFFSVIRKYLNPNDHEKSLAQMLSLNKWACKKQVPYFGKKYIMWHRLCFFFSIGPKQRHSPIKPLPCPVEEGEEFVIWNGPLTIKGKYACYVNMLSSATWFKPAKL